MRRHGWPPSWRSSWPGRMTCAGALTEIVRLMAQMERRVGKALFREMLALHFSPNRPEVLPGTEQWADYPMMTLVVRAVGLARDRGEAYPEADALRTAQFFMLGLYAVLITSHDQSRRPRGPRSSITSSPRCSGAWKPGPGNSEPDTCPLPFRCRWGARRSWFPGRWACGAGWGRPSSRSLARAGATRLRLSAAATARSSAQVVGRAGQVDGVDVHVGREPRRRSPRCGRSGC